MVDHKSKADFNAMSVAELKKYLQERGISVSGYLKTSLVESPPQSKKWFCQWIQISKRRRPCLGELIIHDILIPLRLLTVLTRRRRLDCTTYLII